MATTTRKRNIVVTGAETGSTESTLSPKHVGLLDELFLNYGWLDFTPSKRIWSKEWFFAALFGLTCGYDSYQTMVTLMPPTNPGKSQIGAVLVGCAFVYIWTQAALLVAVWARHCRDSWKHLVGYIYICGSFGLALSFLMLYGHGPMGNTFKKMIRDTCDSQFGHLFGFDWCSVQRSAWPHVFK